MTILKYAFAGMILMGAVNVNAQLETKTTGTATEVKKQKTPEERAVKKVEKLDAELSLTDEQKTKIEALSANLITSTKKVKADKTTTAEVKKAQTKNLKEQYNTDLNAILDESQTAKLAEIKAAKKEQRAENKASQSDKLTVELTEVLSLTPEQQEQVRNLNEKVAMKIAAIKADDTMDQAKKKEFIKGNKADRKKVMTSILTDEQLVKYEAWLASKKDTRKEKKAGNAVDK